MTLNRLNAVFHGARVIDPMVGADSIRDVAIRDGVVAEWPCEVSADCLHVDCAGLVLAPAFIDLHCHLREPGYEQKETVASGTAAAAAGGFGTICCMPNTRPALDSIARIREFNDIVRRDAVVTVYPIAAATLGRRGESLVDIRALAAEGVVAFSDDGDYVADSVVMRDVLSQAARAGLPVMDHAQDGRLVSGGVMHEGDAARRLKLRGMPAEAEEVAVGRDIALARMTGGHVHICHITTARAVDMVRRAKEEGVRVTAEATPHHLTLTDEDCVAASPSGAATFNNDAKVNPPLRPGGDVHAVVRGLADGTINAIATDHAPHTAADKVGSPGEAAFGISVFETALASVLELYHRGEVSLARLVYCLTVGPSGILGARPPLPAAAPGVTARLVLFDPEASWLVDPTRFHSRGRNTPLAGRVMKGMVLATLLDGRFVYVADSLAGRWTGTEPPTSGIHRASLGGGANPNGC
jgi:dihydroorotase